MSTPAEQTPVPTPPARSRWRWLWLFVGITAGGVAAIVLAVALLLGWLLATPSGLARLAALAESASDGAVRMAGVDGRLMDRLSIAELRVDLPDLRVEARQLALAWSPAELFERRLEIAQLAVGSLRMATRPGEKTAPRAPETLSIPLEVRLGALTVGEFAQHAWAEGELGAEQFRASAIEARVDADPDAYRIDAFAAELPWGKALLSGRVESSHPFVLAFKGTLDGAHEGRDFHLGIDAQGDLIRPELMLKAEGAGLAGEARVTARSFEAVPIERAVVSLGEIDPSAFSKGAPAAALRIRADLAVAEAAEGQLPAPEEWTVSGPLEVLNAKPGDWSTGKIPLERLAARLSWSAGALRAEEIDARLAGKGRVTGKAGWRPLAEDAFGGFDAALKLSAVNPQALDARLPKAQLQGRIDGRGDGARQQLEANIKDASIALKLSAILEKSVLQLTRVQLTQGKAQLEGSARLGIDAEMAFTAKLKLNSFDPQPLYSAAPSADLNLALELDGRLKPALAAKVDYRLAPSTLEGRSLEGEGRMTLTPERLADADLWLNLAGNRLEARGGWGGTGDELRLSLDAAALDTLLEGLEGRVAASATLAGSRQEPAGEVLLSASRLTLPGGVTLTGLNAQGELQRGLDGPFVVAAGVGEILGPERNVLLDRVAIGVEGTRTAHRVALSAAATEGDEIALQLQGGLGEDLSWQGTLESLETQGRVALRLDAPARLLASRESVRLGTARLSTSNGAVELVQTEWSAAGAHVQGKMSGLGVGLVRDAEGRLRREAGELRLGGEWDLRIADKINGLARVFRESGDLVLVGDASARLGLQTLEAVLSVTDGALALSAEAQGQQLGRFSASATARAERSDTGLRLVPDAPVLGSARLDMPSIAWLGRLLNANLVTGGALDAEFSLSGTPEAPVASGRLLGKELELSLVDAGLRLSGGSLEALFDRDYVRVARLEFLSPNRVKPREPRIPIDRIVAEPGRFSASGGINLATGEGRFGFRAERLPLLQRTDRWLAVSGEGGFDSGWDRLDLRAELEADGGSISIGAAPPPSLSDDVVILGRERPPSRFAVAADITVRMGEAFYLTAMGLDTRLAGGLKITARSGKPTVASGVIRMEDGVYEGYGQKLAVESSSVSFSGTPENPSLNITALRKGLEVEAGVSVTGTARRPRVRLVSFPNVPDTEKLSWIVLGRAPDPSSSADLGLLIPAAQALLGGPGGGMTSQLSSTLGFDQFSIGQGDLNSVSRGATSSVVDSGVRTGESGTVSGQVVTLGKRLSTDTFLAFEQSLAGAESIVKLTHQLGRRVSVVARGGTDNAIDIFYTFVFR